MPEFADLTAPESARVLDEDSVVLLGVGSLEQHGPHLPVSTDYTVADAASRAVTARAGDDADLAIWRLPTLAFSKSDEHAWSSGTVWLSWDTLMRVLVDVGRSVAATPARRLVFLNGHGGNSALLQVACRELRRQFGLRTFLMHLSVPIDQGGPGRGVADEHGLGVHGGHSETSIMLHLRPDLVHMDKAVRSVPEKLLDYERVGFGKPVSFGWLSDDFGTDGTLGDPTGATAETGRALFDAGVSEAIESLREIARFDPR